MIQSNSGRRLQVAESDDYNRPKLPPRRALNSSQEQNDAFSTAREDPGTSIDVFPDSTLQASLGNATHDDSFESETVRMEREVTRKKLDKFLDRAQRTFNSETLGLIREKLLEYARERRTQGSWDRSIEGKQLKSILEIIELRQTKYRSSSLQVLEVPELSKKLREDPYQHTCDVKMCCRMSIGWLCIFFFCHIPWITAIFLVGVQYKLQITDLGVNYTSEYPDTDQACNSVASYTLGFFIIYCVNLVLGFAFAVARNVDENKNSVVRLGPYCMRFVSVVLLAYNLYGVIVVWDSALWSVNANSACVSMRILAVALLSFFLALPVVYFGIIQIVRKTRGQISKEADPVPHGAEGINGTGSYEKSGPNTGNKQVAVV